MPTPTVTPLVAGIDVGKSRLDVHVLPLDRSRSFANDRSGRRAARNWLRKLGVVRAVFEPTARYHRRLHQCLFDSGLETVPANPLRSRRFAEALGQLAKNDRVDARLLAAYGQLDNLRSVPPKPAQLSDLSDLVALRRQLVGQREGLRKLQREIGCEAARQVGATALADLDARIRELDRRVSECLAADESLARRAAILQSVPGCGPVCAAGLCADMPQLGTLQRRQAAALLGVAPYDNQSGASDGPRRIRGGRRYPRNLLYMAAVSAIRCHAACQALYQRLLNKGRQPKVALVAVMRQLVTLCNALLRDNRTWQPEPPPREALACMPPPCRPSLAAAACCRPPVARQPHYP